MQRSERFKKALPMLLLVGCIIIFALCLFVWPLDIIFDTPRVTHIIEALEPDMYVKGGDYTLDALDAEERHTMESLGTQIMLLPEITGFSTTNVIERVRDNCC